MSFSSRFFLITDEDEVLRVPQALFKRLLASPATDRLPQFNNQRLRFADITVRLQNRKPDGVARSHFYHIRFTSDGAIDESQFMHDGAIMMDAADGLPETTQSDTSIIYAQKQFAQRERENSITWTPNPALEKMILNAALDLIDFPTVRSLTTD